ncbi:MAG: hypothetical protein PHI12_06685 [Dehalococcoidales bacterium]|nr:hypothetical protein [Dehalococcoidales bacterium]
MTDHIVTFAPAKIAQIREAGRKALSPNEFAQLNELLSQLAIYGLTPYINANLGRLMAKFGWELEISESPEWAEALIACDVAFLGSELKSLCRENGMSDYGHKKELCRRLYNAKVPEVVDIMGPIIEKGSTAEAEKQPGQGELEKFVRSSPILSSNRYTIKKLDEWDLPTKQSYVKAYDGRDWDRVNNLTGDLSGGDVYIRKVTREQLYDVIKEQLRESKEA